MNSEDFSWASDAVFELKARNEEIEDCLDQVDSAIYGESKPEEQWMLHLAQQWNQGFMNFRLTGTPLMIKDVPRAENCEEEEILACHPDTKKTENCEKSLECYEDTEDFPTLSQHDEIIMCLLKRIWNECVPKWVRQKQPHKKERVRSSVFTPHTINLSTDIFDSPKPKQFLPPVTGSAHSRIPIPEGKRYSSALSKKSSISRLPPICSSKLPVKSRTVSASDPLTLSIGGSKIIPKKRKNRNKEQLVDLDEYDLPLLIQEMEISADLARYNRKQF